MSVVNHRLKTTFVHIPKTAGVAICASLGLHIRGHRRFQEIRRRTPANYFVFSVVRNPWDRLVSSYTYFKAGGRGFPNDKAMQRTLSRYKTFADFCEEITPELLDQWTKIVPHFLPQVYWQHPRINKVYRFENLKEDFADVCSHIETTPVPLLRRNASDHARYTEYYDCSSQAKVAEIYSNDIETYNYTFGD
jgi:chondroitin 4-sulfotransferase 11